VRVVVVETVEPQPIRVVQSVRVQDVESVQASVRLVTLHEAVQRRTGVRSAGLQSSSPPKGGGGMGQTGPTQVGW